MGRRKKVVTSGSNAASNDGSMEDEFVYYRNVNIMDNTRMHRVSSLYGGNSDTWSVAGDDSDYDDPFTPKEVEGTFLDQFLATIHHIVQDMRRDVIGTALEFIVPLLFIVLAIVLWAVFKVEKMPEKNQLNFNQLLVTADPGFYVNVFCLKEPIADIPFLERCGVQGFEDVYCEGDESQIPVKGLCSIRSTANTTAIFLNSLLGNAVAVPELDGIILNQWNALKLPPELTTSIALSLSSATPSTRLSALMSSGKLFFAPRSKVPSGFFDFVNNVSFLFKYVQGDTFDTIEEAKRHVASQADRNWAIVEFLEWGKSDFDVKLHMNMSALPTLTSTEDIMYPGGFQFNRGELYMASGFSTLQRLLYDFYLMSEWGQNNTRDAYRPYFAALGSGRYQRKMLIEAASPLVAFIFVLAFLYPVSQLTRKLVLEKELRIREAMLIMGLKSVSLNLSWFVVYTLQYVLQCAIMTILLKVTLLDYSNAYVVFLLFLVFALTTIPLSGMIAAFFSKARLAAMMAPLIFFVISIPVFAFSSSSDGVIIGFSVLSPTAFASLIVPVLTLEASVGFSTSDFTNKKLHPRPYILLIMLIVEIPVYYLLMLYLDAVMPKDWGTRRNPLFFITDPIRYCIRWKSRHDTLVEDGRAEDGIFEESDEDTEPTVVISGLRKEYKRNWKKFVAVNNLYLTMREGEISVLLGHNGAGKTTVINMMTGMIEPDQGDCYVLGMSVRSDLGSVRKQIGYCPQHNILWPELTCREHLEFFAKIKGLKGWDLEDAVRAMLKCVDLTSKADSATRTLSGGQKRKLSIAIAFVGRSPVIFLDEPTAGMDVSARRWTWELLRRVTTTHTIMLTTHYMDEADLLGHRIGIMSQGRLKCTGSSMFLKSRLGTGYSLNVSLYADGDPELVDQVVSSFIGNPETSKFESVEIIYHLPVTDVEVFPQLLTGLDGHAELAGIRGYSLSATTLEEVFLQIAMSDTYEDPDGAVDEETLELENDLVWNSEVISGCGRRLLSQFSATMRKRLWNGLRDRRMQCFQIVCPVVCILIAMLFALVKFNTTGDIFVSSTMFDTDVEMELSNCQPYFGTVHSPFERTYMDDRNFRTSMDMSYYTIDTYMLHPRPRYTSIFCNDTLNNNPDYSEMGDKSILFYNTSAHHASGIVLQQFYSFILRAITGNSMRSFNTRATVLAQTKAEKKVQGGVQTVLIGAIVMIPFTFLPSNAVAWVVKERECRARHQQRIAGMNFYVYWLCNFLFDLVAYIISMALVIIIFVIFSREEYVSSHTAGPTIVMFLTYGFCSTVAGYSLSFVFNEHATAQTVTMGVSFITGFILAMLVFVMSLTEATQDTSDTLRWIFRIVPSYCVGESVINLSSRYQEQLHGRVKSAWSMSVVGWPCVYMAAEFPVFVALTLVIDHPRRRMWSRRRRYERSAPAEVVDGEDSDVEAERNSVYENEAANVNEDVVRVVDMRKVYPGGKVAVRNLAFSVKAGEVFGFLGTNGAGKTTAVSIFCQEFLPSSGCVYVCGYDIVAESEDALSCIGYCPQFDTTLDLLTVEEHLYLYAGIRGIRYDQRDTVVNGLIRLCGVTEYRKTVSGKLSGGNRRKLSVAIALLGAPSVVFLDEPSAGMDPVARRGLWSTIQRVSQKCSVVLTTHHLEEVEALADVVAIMADGSMRCFGDKMHLKSKYGSGFEMSIRVSTKDMVSDVQMFVEESFLNATLNERNGLRLIYALPRDVSLSEAFAILQANKAQYRITDYSVSQTSIEQVFMRISEEQDAREASRAHQQEPPARFTRSHAELHDYGGNSTRDRQYRHLSDDDSDYGSTGGRLQPTQSFISSASIAAYKSRGGGRDSYHEEGENTEVGDEDSGEYFSDDVVNIVDEQQEEYDEEREYDEITYYL